MKVTETRLGGVLLVEPRVFADARGCFFETWQAARYAAAGIAGPFVQDNVSVSGKGVLRGLHFQNPSAQGKLVFPLDGQIYDVAVDVRVGSPTFGKWIGVTLTSAPCMQIWVPPGFAHGFCVTSESAVVVYKCTDVYVPAAEHGIAWNDPELAIPWPVAAPILSEKDRGCPTLAETPRERLFGFPL